MTANPAKPARYRPGKPVAPEVSSEEEVDEEEETEEAETAQKQPNVPPPKVTSFRPDATRIADSLKNVDLTERQRQAAAEETARIRAQQAQRAKDEEGFVTEGSEEEGSEETEESESEGEEESSEEEEQPKRQLLRPTFIKKDKRQLPTATAQIDAEEERRRREEEERKKAADEIVQEQIRRDAEARAAGKKYWDDEEVGEEDAVDDTDGLDPEAELAAWKLRELKRVKRDREAVEEAEQEREEVERRRNLTAEEREAEDQAFIARQKEEKEGKGKMAYMQKYFHKGAFFQDDAKDKGLDRRDIMGSRYQDDISNRELLPQYMQIRDMTRLGRKGRTRYKDLKSEDTGRWGKFDDRRPRSDRADGGFVDDDRFMPDRNGGATGANASAVGERKKVEGAPDGPRAMRDAVESHGERGQGRGDARDSYRPSRDTGNNRDDEDYRHREHRRQERGDSDDNDRGLNKSSRYHSPPSGSSRKQRPRSRSRSHSRSRRRSPLRGYRDQGQSRDSDNYRDRDGYRDRDSYRDRDRCRERDEDVGPSREDRGRERSTKRYRSRSRSRSPYARKERSVFEREDKRRRVEVGY